MAAVAIALAVGFAAGAAWVVQSGLPDGPPPDPGPAAAEELVRDYVAALNTGDASVLAAVLNLPATASDVVARMARYGGFDLQVTSLSVATEFPLVYILRFRVNSAGAGTIDLYEVAEWTDTGWRMAPLATPRP